MDFSLPKNFQESNEKDGYKGYSLDEVESSLILPAHRFPRFSEAPLHQNQGGQFFEMKL